MSRVKGKAAVAQSGGPTTAINSSVAGVVETAMANNQFITGVYGAHNGILGVLREELFDLGKEDPRQLRLMRSSPAAALGSCRYKLKDFDKNRTDYERILEVFKAHDIRYFFYAGGNDSMDTASKVARLAAEMKYEMLVVGVPKTIDNDLAFTDHCPGYGSVAKFNAIAAMEAGRDTEALCTADTVTVMECMGRNAGWIAAATALAHRAPADAPHLIYLPEVPFEIGRFVEDVRGVLTALGYCFICAGEGIRDAQGRFIAEVGGTFGQDAFGHKQLGGAGQALRQVVEKELGVKCRYNNSGTWQRTGMHCASATDLAEAYMAGSTAVKTALSGVTGKMVTLVRDDSEGCYRCTTGLVDLVEVANAEKSVPRAFINAAGNGMMPAFLEYVRPLVWGQADVEIGTDGLPVYCRLARHMVAKQTGREYRV